MDTGSTFTNLGAGSQYVSSGTQNVNSSDGNQYNANTITFHLQNQHNDPNLLADLRVTDPRYDKKRIQDTNGGLLTDSYIWVLQNPEFCRWHDDEDQRLLWVKGDPGKGKTMLLCGIVSELQATRKGKPLSYFFCQATDERINTATAVLRGLIFILLDQDPSLVSYIKKKYDIAGKALFQDKNAWQAMSEIFKDMLCDSKLQGVLLLVDALDECSTGLDQLLDLITETSQSTRAKWLVSSRNWSQIEEKLHTIAQRLSLEVNAKSVSTAVNIYIQHKVEKLAEEKGYSSKTRNRVLRYLSSHAGDTFLWAALVCQELKAVPELEVRKRVKTFPAGLKPLYQRMMQQVCESTVSEKCKKFLAVTVLVYRPLSLAEYGSIYNLPGDTELDDSESEDDDYDYISQDESKSILVKLMKELVSYCGSFLTIRKDIVYFVHQSAKDFLLSKEYTAFNQILPSGIAYQHHSIFSRSLEVLSKTLRRNIYELRAPGSSIEDISPPDPNPLASLKYSSTHWVDHLEHSNPADSPTCVDLQDNGSVHTFLKWHYLHWLETQSLLQSMPQAVLAMQKLQILVPSPEKQLTELIRDACRFVLSYKQCIESCPLQIYTAPLLFSPTNSLVRQLFRAEAPAGITMITKGDIDWNACQQTLEGHSGPVWSLAFCPDGRQLASGSYDSTVKLWDTATGQCQQTLQGHSSLENVFKVAIQEPTQELIGHRHMLSQQGVWITNRSQNILWLPPEYRASSHAEDGSKIAVGCRSGRVLLLCFESEYQQA